MNRTVIPHLLGMFVCNLAIAFSSMDALEVTIGQAAYSPMFQISRALAAVILPLVIAAVPVLTYRKLRENRSAVIIWFWFVWAALGAIPLGGSLLGELGDGFSLLSYNWLPAG